ncbi:MAG: IS30 family transposase [Treponema sp.]|nr:IS30 family transposase [Treponema sp.]
MRGGFGGTEKPVLLRFPNKSARLQLPPRPRRTLTYDNGLENALHDLVNKESGTKSYFCKPYHSWEKGSIKNRNGILRRCYPKKRDFALTSQKEINRIVSKINSTLVKCLSYKPPLRFLPNAGVLRLPLESGAHTIGITPKEHGRLKK